MPSKIYYKLIRECNRSSIGNTPYPVTYPANKWVKPTIKNSKLMVFNTYANAKRFKDYIGRNGIIVPCYIRGAKTKNLKLARSVFGVRELWDHYNLSHIEDFYCDIPIGTVFANEVFCLE